MPLPPVIFEDDTLIAFDKPSGLLVAPDRWDKQRENLMGLVHAKLGDHVANVHRLDADTSGLLICTKNKPALDFVSGQFQSKTVRKKYHAFAVVLPIDEAMKVVQPIRDAAGALPDEFIVDLALGVSIRALRSGSFSRATRMISRARGAAAEAPNPPCSTRTLSA